ncbi:MAG: type III-B CRISPR module RAMP protein Cmr1, partial [Thermodesulfobacteriota bacterium]
MCELKVTLETVTPLFLGGAAPRGAPELRAPSFRGALRYWLRALVGAAGERSMRQHEDRLFGVGGDHAA